MPNFSTAEQILSTIRAGDDAAWYQGRNRQRINDAANGNPPMDKATADKLNLRINVNFGDLAVPLAHARRSYDEAVLGQERYFKVNVPLAPEQKKTGWELFITNYINDDLREDEDLSQQYLSLKEFQIGALVAHGLGPMLWYDDDCILPDFTPLEDLRVPTDTLVSFKNMEWFAIRHRYTPGELVNKVWGKYAMPGWDKSAIKEILHNVKGVNYGEVNYTWESAPEKMAELVKQNMGYYSADAMPTIGVWCFYFQDQDGGRQWYMSAVPDTQATPGTTSTKFLFKSDKPVAKKLSRLFQCQYGDLNTKTPFLFHSVRSLGYLLMEPTWWGNLTRCRLLQHAHESMNIWLKVNDPVGKSRAQMVELFEKCIVPDGVSVVPQSERHQIDANLVVAVQGQVKQLVNEASSHYTNELDTGTQKEQTATETMANLQRVNAMMSGLLSRFFRKEKWFHREICRRYCKQDTTNEYAKKFQEAARRFGIPPKFLDVDLWVIEPTRPMGSGNPTMALMQADKMMEVRPMLGPEAQQEVLHDAVAIYTNDPRRASRLVPIDGNKGLSTGAEFAQAIFGTLMQGVPVMPKEGLSPIDQIETLLGLLAGKLAGIAQAGNTSDMNTINGLAQVSQFIGQLTAQLAQNPAEKQRVKAYGDALGQLNNEIKALAQRAQEAQASQNGQDGELQQAQAKIQSMLMQSAAKAKQTELNQAQRRRHKELGWQSEQKRKNAETAAEIRRQGVKNINEIEQQNIIAANEPTEPATTE